MKLTAIIGLLFIAAVVVAHDHKARISFTPEISKEYTVNLVNGIPKPLTSAKSNTAALDVALEFAKSTIGNSDFVVKDSYKTEFNGITHVYLRQIVKGLEVMNGDMNINIDKNGQVISFGNSFAKSIQVNINTEPNIAPFSALKSLSSRLGVQLLSTPEVVSQEAGVEQKFVVKAEGLSLDNIPMKLAFMRVGDELVLTWNAVIRQDNDWFDCQVNANSGEVTSMVNWVSDALYNVFNPPVNDPENGPRSVVIDPHLKAPNASPSGWHDRGPNGGKSEFTIGNNVYAQENLRGGSTWENNYRPSGGSVLSFDFPLDLTLDPSRYVDASVTNLFYLNNYVHDLFYQYGFDEVSGNFQEYNYGKGGREFDAVQANAQDGAGYNNANFATPPDGQRPKMRMYVWTTTTPYRDGDFENSIIIHEYGHGISNRLTGGPSNSNCLSGGQSGGMGEGWSDLWGTMAKQRPEYNRNTAFPMSPYVVTEGIRYFPYTSDMTINPQTFGIINTSDYSGVHAKGSVWCSILWEVYWNMVEKHGFSTDLFYGQGGNNKFLRNVVDGLKLQPCSPSFIDARDAIIQADQNNFGGQNVCDMWKGFAKRGLGYSATTGFRVTEAFDLPPSC